MTPVHQEFYAKHEGEKPGPGVYGDCFRAALASLLDLPLQEVPHFAKDADGDGALFWCLINHWLSARGQALILSRGFDFTIQQRAGMAPVFHLILGTCADGYPHVWVALSGRLIFDPNPSQLAIVTKPEDLVFGFVVSAAACGVPS